MFDTVVTHFAPGSNNHRDTALFSDFYLQDRINKIHEYSQDFDQYIAADYVNTLNGGTAALAAGDGGLLLLTTVASNFVSVAKTPADFQLAKTFRAWFAARVQVDNVLGLVLAGMLNATATPFTGASQTDGIIFVSDNTGALSLKICVGGVISTTALGVSLVAAQQAFLGWYYDGACYASAPTANGRVVWETFINGVTVRGVVNIPVSGTIAAFPGAVNISPIVGVSASTAAVRTLTVDMEYAAKDRVSPIATI